MRAGREGINTCLGRSGYCSNYSTSASDRGVEKKGKGRPFKTLGFHSLRHTFVSELANADVPADVRRQISGHSDEKIHERYTHLDVDTRRRAVAHLRPLNEPGI